MQHKPALVGCENSAKGTRSPQTRRASIAGEEKMKGKKLVKKEIDVPASTSAVLKIITAYESLVYTGN
jgi:hypothetical protein